MKILKYPDPILRKKSEVVTLPLSEEDRELIEDIPGINNYFDSKFEIDEAAAQS